MHVDVCPMDNPTSIEKVVGISIFLISILLNVPVLWNLIQPSFPLVAFPALPFAFLVYLALREKYFPLKRLYLVATAAVGAAGLIEGVVIMLGGSYIFTVLPLYNMLAGFMCLLSLREMRRVPSRKRDRIGILALNLFTLFSIFTSRLSFSGISETSPEGLISLIPGVVLCVPFAYMHFKVIGNEQN